MKDGLITFLFSSIGAGWTKTEIGNLSKFNFLEQVLIFFFILCVAILSGAIWQFISGITTFIKKQWTGFTGEKNLLTGHRLG